MEEKKRFVWNSYFHLKAPQFPTKSKFKNLEWKNCEQCSHKPNETIQIEIFQVMKKKKYFVWNLQFLPQTPLTTERGGILTELWVTSLILGWLNHYWHNWPTCMLTDPLSAGFIYIEGDWPTFGMTDLLSVPLTHFLHIWPTSGWLAHFWHEWLTFRVTDPFSACLA